MTSTKITNLPIPQSGCGNTRLSCDGLNLSIEFEYRSQGTDIIGTICFEAVVAYRFSNEMHSEGFISEAYESVAEVLNSDWKMKLAAIAPAGVTDALSARHFAMFLSSNGYFEVLAESVRVEEPRFGLLP
jgi:hypothetical protein